MEISKLFQAMQNGTRTENGMPSFKSTLDYNVDLFFKIGASRGQDIRDDFFRALNSNEDYATRILLWSRDIREGAGERKIFRDILSDKRFKPTKNFIDKIPELGRWDDLLVLTDRFDYAGKYALQVIRQGLIEDNGLCAKWMPRKGLYASRLRKYLKLTPKKYRKLLVHLTNVVETKMCSNDWNSIDYGKLPSLASARYQKAFGRHSPERYGEYLNKLESGEEKINAGAVYPYDIVKSLAKGNETASNEMWKNLPDYIDNDKTFLPVIDVSGSMYADIPGTNLEAMDISISLGLYCSEKNKSFFKDKFITFSENPQLQEVRGNLAQRVQMIRDANWGYNTDIMRVFNLILTAAISHKLNQSDLPDYVLIISDMQFDKAAGNQSALASIESLYKRYGYEMPNIVFWNVMDRAGNIPCTVNDTGAALISGFSPSIMKSVLNAKIVTPEDIMKETILKPRYNWR